MDKYWLKVGMDPSLNYFLMFFLWIDRPISYIEISDFCIIQLYLSGNTKCWGSKYCDWSMFSFVSRLFYNKNIVFVLMWRKSYWDRLLLWQSIISDYTIFLIKWLHFNCRPIGCLFQIVSIQLRNASEFV